MAVRREREAGNPPAFSQAGEMLPAGRIPDADLPRGVSSYQGWTVGTERDARDWVALGQGRGLPPRRHVPQHDMVPAAVVAGGQGAPVRAERDTPDRVALG